MEGLLRGFPLESPLQVRVQRRLRGDLRGVYAVLLPLQGQGFGFLFRLPFRGRLRPDSVLRQYIV